MKKLYVLPRNLGDGSVGIEFTFNEQWIKQMEEKDLNGDLDYDSGWVDGDGFHYETLTVPEECTLEFLGINWDCAEE